MGNRLSTAGLGMLGVLTAGAALAGEVGKLDTKKETPDEVGVLPKLFKTEYPHLVAKIKSACEIDLGLKNCADEDTGVLCSEMKLIADPYLRGLALNWSGAVEGEKSGLTAKNKACVKEQTQRFFTDELTEAAKPLQSLCTDRFMLNDDGAITPSQASWLEPEQHLFKSTLSESAKAAIRNMFGEKNSSKDFGLYCAEAMPVDPAREAQLATQVFDSALRFGAAVKNSKSPGCGFTLPFPSAKLGEGNILTSYDVVTNAQGEEVKIPSFTYSVPLTPGQMLKVSKSSKPENILACVGSVLEGPKPSSKSKKKSTGNPFSVPYPDVHVRIDTKPTPDELKIEGTYPEFPKRADFAEAMDD